MAGTVGFFTRSLFVHDSNAKEHRKQKLSDSTPFFGILMERNPNEIWGAEESKNRHLSFLSQNCNSQNRTMCYLSFCYLPFGHFGHFRALLATFGILGFFGTFFWLVVATLATDFVQQHKQLPILQIEFPRPNTTPTHVNY